jgi:hypothetical protein
LLDSLLKDTIHTVSLFKNHLLIPKNNETKLHITNYNYLITVLLLFLFGFFVWLYSTNRTRLSQIIKGFYINRVANQIVREDYSFGNRFAVFLSLIFIFSLSIFISQTLHFYDINIFPPSFSFIIIMGVVVFCYALKLIIGSIFEVQKPCSDYLMTVFLFCNVLGIFLLPLVITISFAKQLTPQVFIFIGFIMVILFFLVRIIRGIYIGLITYRLPKFYLFLYLCALEILPLIFLIKLFFIKSNS